MKFALLVLTAALLGGCAIHSPETLARARAQGVSERTMAKLEHRGILVPNDLIELHRLAVPDAVPVHHLDRVGVDYAVEPADMRRLRAAGVRPAVNDALLDASRRFVRDLYAPRSYFAIGAYPYPWSYGGLWWWPYSDLSVGYSWGHWRNPGHWDRHR